MEKNDSELTGEAAKRGFDPVLATIAVLAAIGGAALVGRAKNWAVMPDELIYVELSRSIASSLLPIPAFQGHWGGTLQILYPTLISPLVGLLKMPDAYPWIAVLNAWLFASTAVPAYLITSWVTRSRSAARWVALCTVIVPWLTLSSMVLPDATAYAAGTWAFYAIMRTAAPRERAFKGDLLALLAIAVAFAVRNQFLFLLGVWAGAIGVTTIAAAVHAGRARAIPPAVLKAIRERWVPILTCLVCGLLLIFKPAWLLGFYTSVSTNLGNDTPNEGLLTELSNHIGAIGYGVVVLPFVFGLAWLCSALGRIGDLRQFSAAWAILIASVAVILIVTRFDMRFDPTERVIERYLFYLAPLWFAAMAACFARPPKSLPAFALPALLGVLLLISSSPYGLDSPLNWMINRPFSPTQITLIGWQRAADAVGSSISGLTIILVLAIGGLVWWLIGKQRSGIAQTVCFALVAAALLASTIPITNDVIKAQNKATISKAGARTTSQKAWIETATGKAPYAVEYAPRSILERVAGREVEDRWVWRDTIFWNRGLKTVYMPFRNPLYIGNPFPTTRVYAMIPDWKTGRIARAPGDDTSYLLMSVGDPRFAPQTSSPPLVRYGMVLYKTPGARYASFAVRGLTPSGWVSPGGATMRVYAPRNATKPQPLRITLTAKGVGDHAPTGFKVTGTGSQTSVRTEKLDSITWRATPQPGGYVDFKLVRGSSPVRITRVTVAER